MSSEVTDALERVRALAAELQPVAADLAPLCRDAAASHAHADGLSLLHAKSATLLRYNLNLARLALARVRGGDVRALAEKLAADWVALAKLRPLEKKLQHHLDQLLGAGTGGTSGGGGSGGVDGNRLRPNPAALVLDERGDADSGDEGDGNGRSRGDDGDGEDDGVYRPPRLAEMVYDAGGARRREREERERARFQKRARLSEGVREMVAELRGLPEEVREAGGDAAMSGAARRLRKEDEHKRRFEEDNFARVALSKADKKRRKEMERAAGRGAAQGADEVSGLVSMAERVVGGKAGKGKKGKRERRVGVDGLADVEEEDLKRRKLDEALDV